MDKVFLFPFAVLDSLGGGEGDMAGLRCFPAAFALIAEEGGGMGRPELS